MTEIAEKQSSLPTGSPVLAALLSLVPGLGHLYAGYRRRGVGLLITIIILVALVWWRRDTTLLRLGPLAVPTIALAFLVLILWLWAIWDAYLLSGGRRTALGVPVILSAVVIYAIGWQVTQINLYKLISEWPDAQPFVVSLLSPDVIERDKEILLVQAKVQVPCAESPPAPPSASGSYLVISATCGEVGDTIQVQGYGFWPNSLVNIWWENSTGQSFRLRQGGEYLMPKSDEAGQFSVDILIPPAIAGTEVGGAQVNNLQARSERDTGGLHLSNTFYQVVDKMAETVFLALMATTISLPISVGVSFLAARNIMSGNSLARSIYYAVRTVLNIFRSIEPLVLAVVFVVWVGLGPFAGVLALALHSIAALGKLYSEAVESVDPGPIEAITATGANRLQVIAYGIVPQIIPPFVSFTIYRWDINVRMSTVIGLVGGGGIGLLLLQWINLFQWRQAATALWAITIVVAAMDYFSAIVREKIV